MSEMIEAHTRHLRAGRASPKTILARGRILRALHRDLPFGLAYASTDEIEAWLGGHPEWSPWTHYTYATHIRSFYRWAAGRWLEEDPAAYMAQVRKPRSVPNPVTTEQLETALERAPAPWHTAITLAAYAGLRVGELCGVHREDVTRDTIRIRVAKGGDPAAVDTHPIVWAMVEPRPPGPLCRMPRGKQLTDWWVEQRERKFFDSIDLPGVTMHRFRHWFGTTMLDNGASVRAVQEALRHKSIVSTQGYTLVRGEQRRLAVRTLPTPSEHPDERRS